MGVLVHEGIRSVAKLADFSEGHVCGYIIIEEHFHLIFFEDVINPPF